MNRLHSTLLDRTECCYVLSCVSAWLVGMQCYDAASPSAPHVCPICRCLASHHHQAALSCPAPLRQAWRMPATGTCPTNQPFQCMSVLQAPGKPAGGGAAELSRSTEAGLEDASYRNLPEARLALQALHALMAAGANSNSSSISSSSSVCAHHVTGIPIDCQLSLQHACQQQPPPRRCHNLNQASCHGCNDCCLRRCRNMGDPDQMQLPPLHCLSLLCLICRRR